MEVNEEFYTPGRGWERVDAVGITRARVDGVSMSKVPRTIVQQNRDRR